MMNDLTIHHTPDPFADTSLPDPNEDTFSKNVLGFWIYLMTDCLLFAVLFTTYTIFHKQTFGGPSSNDIFHLPTAFSETMLLLFSSLTSGLALLASLKNDRKLVIIWLIVTFILGASFLAIELNEFSHLIREGNSWSRSAFLSSFFTLVGTHGLHITTGLTWITIMVLQLIFIGLNATTFRRLVIFNMFWHFLDLIWIFIFTLVYLIGVL